MSAPFRYARILNGFSSLISRRSAISRRIRAMAALSIAVRMRVVLQPQAVGFDVVVEQSRAAVHERGRDRVARFGRAVAEEAPAAAGAAHFRTDRARGAGARDQIFDRWRRHAGRKTLAVLPFVGDLIPDFIPVTPLERRAHRERRIANTLEAVEDVAVAVDVTL